MFSNILVGGYVGYAIGRLLGTLLWVAIVAFFAFAVAPLVLGFMLYASFADRSFSVPATLLLTALGLED